MKTTVKHLSDTKVELTVALTRDELAQAGQVALHKLAQSVKVPGFRQGKVPASVAAKHIDPNTLAQQSLEDAVSKAVADAFTQENIRVLDRPAVEVKKYVPNETLEFTAEADILPAVTLGNYKKLGVKSEKAVVSAKDVDEIIDRMRQNMAEKKPVKRAAKNGDVVTIDFVGKKDGVAFDGGTGTDYDLELGSNSFIPGFEEGIVGLKTGDTKSLELAFPESYHVKDLAGAAVTFDTTVKNVQEKALPEVDDAFVAKVSPGSEVKTVAELKADIKRELTTQKERESAEKHKDALVAKLIEVSKVPVPQLLVDDQAKNIEQDMTQNLTYQNMTLENYLSAQGFKDKDDWYAKEVVPAATKRVQAGLTLAELSKELKVEANSDELAAEVARYKDQYKNSPDMQKRFDEPEIQRELVNRLITEKTVSELVALNT